MSSFSREIRSFLVVSQSESIRSASERMNISAPALSRQIQMLERSYGAALLVRSAGGIALTPEGEALRDIAMGWIADDAAFSKRLRRDEKTSGLVLRLGIVDGLINTLIPPLVKRLEAIYDMVELELVVGSTNQLLARAETQNLDVIVAFNMPRLSRHAVIHAQEYHLGAIHAPGYGPKGSGVVSLADALRFPLCLPSEILAMHDRVMAEILSERVNPDVAISSNSITALLHYLRAGKGVGFLSWPDVATDVNEGKLIFRPIATKRLTETLTVSVCLGNRLGAATAKVISEIQATLTDIGS